MNLSNLALAIALTAWEAAHNGEFHHAPLIQRLFDHSGWKP